MLDVLFPTTLSIRQRLLFLLAAPLGLLLAIGILVDYFSTTRTLQDAYDQALSSSITAISADLKFDAQGLVKSELSEQTIAALRTDNDDSVYYLVLDANGNVVAGDAGLPGNPEACKNAPGRETTSFLDGEFQGQRIRVATSCVGGSVIVAIAETTRKRDHALRRMLASVVATDLLQLMGTLIFVWLGVRVGLRPLLELRDQIAKRSANDLALLEESRTPGEVLPLTQALNRLFATVGETAKSQRQFLADAAHQLRTPLAGLQAQLELHIADIDAAKTLPSVVRERVVGIHMAVLRLAHTAGQFLALARAERAARPIEDFRPLSLNVLLEEIVAANFDRALRRHIDLGVETIEVRIRGSEWLLRELAVNLIDNALIYTPEQGRITVRCGRSADTLPGIQPAVFLEVEDDGPGIPPEERQRVFGRFYRVPRNAHDGTGLGLAIVDEIARAHGATLNIDDGEDGRGTRIRIFFPSCEI